MSQCPSYIRARPFDYKRAHQTHCEGALLCLPLQLQSDHTIQQLVMELARCLHEVCDITNCVVTICLSFGLAKVQVAAEDSRCVRSKESYRDIHKDSRNTNARRNNECRG